jgi:N-acetylmuramoyl-L-alanine amidase
MKRIGTVLGVAILAASLFYLQPLSAADTDFPIYFESSTLALKSQTIDKTTYLPLVDIVRHMGLAYTDATAALTFTIQGQNSRLILTPGSAFISLNERAVLLQNPIRRESGQWLVPLDFLSQGLSRISGIEFRYRPGDPRMFAGNVTPAELVMNAQSLGATTRLTLRTGTPVEVELQRDAAQHRVVLLLKGKPIDPGLERLNYKDRLVSSIAFEDADGVARIVIGTTDEVRDVRITAAEENRVYFADFIRETVTEAAPAATTAPATAGVAKPDVLPVNTSVRVIVIDPGHGGSDNGAANTATLEKDLTLALARRLRTALQSRLGTSVALTRDSDVLLTSEARAQIANNNQAGLFVSLHVGYSPNKADPGSSIYIMKPDFAAGPPPLPGAAPTTTGARLFLPWYMAYRTNQQASQILATQLQQDLNQTLPGWKFPLRSGPIGVLASVTMPAVAIELGNLNNDVSAQTLVDPVFQMKVAATMAAAIEKFTETRGGTGGRGQ